MWDKQFEEDVLSSKLDNLAIQAITDFQAEGREKGWVCDALPGCCCGS